MICPAENENEVIPTDLPDGLLHPYRVHAPSYAAQTKEQLKAKNGIWPCIYALRRTTEAEGYVWSSDELQWVRHGMARVIQEALQAQANDEVNFIAPDANSRTYSSSHRSAWPLTLAVLVPLNILWRQIQDVRQDILFDTQ